MTEVQEAPPPCRCHDVPQYWHTDKRYSLGGFWCCRIKHRERAALWAAANPEKVRAYRAKPAYMEKARKRSRVHYHKADGGYIKRRYRHLAEQRGQILDELGRLANAKSRLS